MAAVFQTLVVLLGAGTLLALEAHAQPGTPATGTFSPSLDQRIAQANAATPTPCDLQQVAGQAGSSAWSAWQTDYCLLANFLVDPAHPALGSYPVPVRLPTPTGRQLFVAGGTPVVLLEFEANRFRFIELGTDDFGAAPSVTHRYYPPAGLLQVQSQTGGMGKAGGETATWLSVLDLTQGKWVLADMLVGVEADLNAAAYHRAERWYQVQENGQLLTLGNYRLDAGPYKYPRLPAVIRRPPDAAADWPAGTYRLLAGHYQRSQPPASPAGLASPPRAGRRPAVGAAEVTGTYRDARGREFKLLAIGGGTVQVAYQPQASPAGRRLRPTGQAIIRADSAVYTASAGGCPLRLYFVGGGTLQVQAPDCPPPGPASAVGSYHKVSSTKPLLAP